MFVKDYMLVLSLVSRRNSFEQVQLKCHIPTIWDFRLILISRMLITLAFSCSLS